MEFWKNWRLKPSQKRSKTKLQSSLQSTPGPIYSIRFRFIISNLCPRSRISLPSANIHVSYCISCAGKRDGLRSFQIDEARVALCKLWHQQLSMGAAYAALQQHQQQESNVELNNATTHPSNRNPVTDETKQEPIMQQQSRTIHARTWQRTGSSRQSLISAETLMEQTKITIHFQECHNILPILIFSVC